VSDRRSEQVASIMLDRVALWLADVSADAARSAMASDPDAPEPAA
jgi:hypothetical protein